LWKNTNSTRDAVDTDPRSAEQFVNLSDLKQKETDNRHATEHGPVSVTHTYGSPVISNPESQNEVFV